MKTTISLVAVGLMAALFWLGGCSYRNVADIKAHAEQMWNKNGYEVIGYEGYQVGTFESPGGRVWYIVRRRGQDNVTYHGYVSKWFGEYHIYELHAIDAIKSN